MEILEEKHENQFREKKKLDYFNIKLENFRFQQNQKMI